MHASFLYVYFIGLIIAVISGPIGSILVWRRISFISDAITHSMIIAIVISQIFSMHNIFTMTLFAFIISIIISYITKIQSIKIDVALSVMTSSFIAIGMFIKDIMNISIDIHSMMFGDILSIEHNNVAYIIVISISIMFVLYMFWSQIIKVSLDKDIAISAGLNIAFIDFVTIFLVSIFSILAVKSIGVLLASALLIIPASVARLYSNTPLAMAFIASIISSLCMIFGIYLSISFDLIPSVVISMNTVVVFIIAMFCFSNYKHP